MKEKFQEIAIPWMMKIDLQTRSADRTTHTRVTETRTVLVMRITWLPDPHPTPQPLLSFHLHLLWSAAVAAGAVVDNPAPTAAASSSPPAVSDTPPATRRA